MDWWRHAYDELEAGREVQIRPRGHSMAGRVNDGDLVTLSPFGDREPQIDDIVLVLVQGNVYLHLIKDKNIDRFMIGNNKGRINGWTRRHNIFGFATKVEQLNHTNS